MLTRWLPAGERACRVFAAPDRDAVDHVLAGIRSALRTRNRRRRPRAVAATRTERHLADRGRASARHCFRRGGVVPGSARRLDLAAACPLDARVIDARDLLVYRVLVNDRPAVTDLIHTLLTPLLEARGGAGPMIDTLLAYFSAGGNAAKTARDLHLSVRAVTYRLDRIRELTGQNVNDPNDSFALHAAVLGAKLLDWPATELT